MNDSIMHPYKNIFYGDKQCTLIEKQILILEYHPVSSLKAGPLARGQ